MSKNLGNIAGVVRGVDPPLEADGVTVKNYVLWAKITNSEPIPESPALWTFDVRFFNPSTDTWVSLTALLTSLDALLSNVGDLTSLGTTDKSSIVAALNEVHNIITDIIDDATTGSSTTYSSYKIIELLTSIVGGASYDYNTLGKIEGILENFNTSIEKVLRVDSTQTFTEIEKDKGASNLDVYRKASIGDPEADLSAYFLTKLSEAEV